MQTAGPITGRTQMFFVTRGGLRRLDTQLARGVSFKLDHTNGVFKPIPMTTPSYTGRARTRKRAREAADAKATQTKRLARAPNPHTPRRAPFHGFAAAPTDLARFDASPNIEDDNVLSWPLKWNSDDPINSNSNTSSSEESAADDAELASILGRASHDTQAPIKIADCVITNSPFSEFIQ